MIRRRGKLQKGFLGAEPTSQVEAIDLGPENQGQTEGSPFAALDWDVAESLDVKGHVQDVRRHKAQVCPDGYGLIAGNIQSVVTEEFCRFAHQTLKSRFKE